jgi:transcriptional regulator with XRE-family HTH domain
MKEQYISINPLFKIAKALDIPVEWFFAARSHSDISAERDEYLRLWSEIGTEEGRRQALQALRSIVELEEASRHKDL